MTDADAFLRDILAHPDDDAPRLIFADWLEEQGDANSSARAEFIRIQCALAAGQLSEQRRTELASREKQILNEWDETWARPIRRLVRKWNFHRGFVDEVATFTDTFLKYTDQLFRCVPLQHLRLWPRLGQSPFPITGMAVLASTEQLCRLRSLDLRENRLDSQHVRAFVVSEHLTSLTELDLSCNRIGDGGIRALAGSLLLGRLKHLNLWGNDIGAGGLLALIHALEELASTPDGLRLQRLDLSPTNLSAVGQRMIAGSSLLRPLVHWRS